MDTLTNGLASPKFQSVCGRYFNPDRIYSDYLNEFAVFVQTPGFRKGDIIKLFRGRIGHAAVNFGLERVVDRELVMENARSITLEDGLMMARIILPRARKVFLPYWAVMSLLELKHNGWTVEEIANRIGCKVKQVETGLRTWSNFGGDLAS